MLPAKGAHAHQKISQINFRSQWCNGMFPCINIFVFSHNGQFGAILAYFELIVYSFQNTCIVQNIAGKAQHDEQNLLITSIHF